MLVVSPKSVHAEDSVSTLAGKSAPAEPTTPLKPADDAYPRAGAADADRRIGVLGRRQKRVAEYERQLERVPMLQGLKREQRQKLIDAIEEVSFHSGEVIVAEGAHALYLIMSGRVALSKRSEATSARARRATSSASARFSRAARRSRLPPRLRRAPSAHRARRIRPHAGQALEAWSTTLAGAKTARGAPSRRGCSRRRRARRGARQPWRSSTHPSSRDTFERRGGLEHAPLHRWPQAHGTGFGKVTAAATRRRARCTRSRSSTRA